MKKSVMLMIPVLAVLAWLTFTRGAYPPPLVADKNTRNQSDQFAAKKNLTMADENAPEATKIGVAGQKTHTDANCLAAEALQSPGNLQNRSVEYAERMLDCLADLEEGSARDRLLDTFKNAALFLFHDEPKQLLENTALLSLLEQYLAHRDDAEYEFYLAQAYYFSGELEDARFYASHLLSDNVLGEQAQALIDDIERALALGQGFGTDDNGNTIIEANIGGIQARLLVDESLATSMINQSFYNNHSDKFSALGGHHSAYRGLWLRVGEHMLREPVFVVTQGDVEGGFDGIAGSDLASRLAAGR